jgi:hypothetical protein
MQELDISGCTGIDATAVATVVAKNRTLSALIFGDGMFGPAALEVGMTEADFRNKDLGMGGAIIISAWITHRDKGALSVTNVMGNRIGKEQLTKLQEIMRAKPNLVSLCGITNGATEADLSGLVMDTDGAAILASELPDKGGLLVLSLESNGLRAAGGKALAEGLKGNPVITELNISNNFLGWTIGVGVLALVCPGLSPLLMSSLI